MLPSASCDPEEEGFKGGLLFRPAARGKLCALFGDEEDMAMPSFRSRASFGRMSASSYARSSGFSDPDRRSTQRFLQTLPHEGGGLHLDPGAIGAPPGFYWLKPLRQAVNGVLEEVPAVYARDVAFVG